MGDGTSKKQDYLGDGVYVEFDGFGFTLKANDHLHPTDTIYLDPCVISQLNLFVEKMKGGE